MVNVMTSNFKMIQPVFLPLTVICLGVFSGQMSAKAESPDVETIQGAIALPEMTSTQGSSVNNRIELRSTLRLEKSSAQEFLKSSIQRKASLLGKPLTLTNRSVNRSVNRLVITPESSVSRASWLAQSGAVDADRSTETPAETVPSNVPTNSTPSTPNNSLPNNSQNRPEAMPDNRMPNTVPSRTPMNSTPATPNNSLPNNLPNNSQSTPEAMPDNTTPNVLPRTDMPDTNRPGTVSPRTTSDTETPASPQNAQSTPNMTTPMQPLAPTVVSPGRSTQSGSSYVGIGGNIGIGSGDTALGSGSFTVISKIGLTRNFSVRPSVLFGNSTTILVPITYDFNFGEGPTGSLGFRAAPYLGVGAAISTGNETKVGLLLTGGVDVPLSSQFTATAAVNASVTGKAAVGILVGVGYNF